MITPLPGATVTKPGSAVSFHGNCTHDPNFDIVLNSLNLIPIIWRGTLRVYMFLSLMIRNLNGFLCNCQGWLVYGTSMVLQNCVSFFSIGLRGLSCFIIVIGFTLMCTSYLLLLMTQCMVCLLDSAL